MASPSDDLTLVVGGQTLSGWTEVRVTIGIEVCPPVFEIALTERFPGETQQYSVRCGQACEVRIGPTPVITGWIDRVHFLQEAGRTAMHIVGRGLTQDLVDCSAEWPTGQISGANAAEIATKLASAYGIGVTLNADPGPAIPQFNFMLGETAWEIIERICRFSGLLVYESSAGELVLGKVGDTLANGGLVEGFNVQRAESEFAVDQRFSEYHVYLMAAQVLGDVGSGGNEIAVEKDQYIRRNRKTFIIAEAPAGGQDISRKRAAWERSRRAGRGGVLRVTTDSWRDDNGEIWTPNTLVPVALPSIGVKDGQVIVSQVTFLRDDRQGTRAELELMAPQAFTVEPIMLLPIFADLQ